MWKWMEKRVEQEAFVYLWYDAPNKKYYLGKHKGTPDNGYTHSSRSSDEFCSIVPDSTRPISERREFFENMPKGVSRRILAYGTHEEMCILEHELLVNRKNRCWDRYYNESLGDPRYVDISGENHPQWKGGISYDMKEYLNEYMKEYRFRNREEILAYKKEYYLRNKEKIQAYKKEYRFRKKEEIQERKKEWYIKNKEKHNAYMREYYLRKKAERQGESNLDRFME
jgi:hypothetical protein